MALQAAVFPGVGMAARPGPPAPKLYDIKANCQPADWYFMEATPRTRWKVQMNG